MTRLQSELHRLYLAGSSTLVDPSGRVRAMVMTLTRPPSWALLSEVWRGVQAELELPAPAIAVSGVDGLQLWFSLAAPIAAPQAHAFLDALRARFLPDVDARRVGLMPTPDASASHPERHARWVPARQEPSGNWSAFVAADLAPVFDDTPWLDIPPNEEGQTTLLRGLETMKPAVFDEALKRLGVGVDAPPAPTRSVPASAADEDPKRFLLRIMNDDSVALALRIEAAKALLQHSTDPRPPQGG